MDKILDHLLASLEELYALEERTGNNELLADYYKNLANSKNDYAQRSERILKCGKIHTHERYARLLINDFQRMYLCKDMFCLNCQKNKANTRVIKYGPALDKVSQTHDLYLLTLSPQNCDEASYAVKVDRLLKAYTKLNGYFAGAMKIAGHSFSHLGYAGSIRSIETTFNTSKRDEGFEYHPHLHAILALSKDLFLKKDIITELSYSYKNLWKDGKKVRERKTRPFCELEITIQKILYLLMTDQRVTGQAIENLGDDEGYRVTLDRADADSYREVFKYSVKPFDDNQQHLEFSQFKTLLQALTGKRLIQGYGIFRNIVEKTEEEKIEQEWVIRTYDEVMYLMRKMDVPEAKHRHISKLKKEMIEGREIFINRRAIFSVTEDNHEEISKLLMERLAEYNSTRKRKEQLTIDDISARVQTLQEVRKSGHEYERQKREELRKRSKARSEERNSWVKLMLREMNIDRASPLYASTKLSLKCEFNELHPLAKEDKPVPLPF